MNASYHIGGGRYKCPRCGEIWVTEHSCSKHSEAASQGWVKLDDGELWFTVSALKEYEFPTPQSESAKKALQDTMRARLTKEDA